MSPFREVGGKGSPLRLVGLLGELLLKGNLGSLLLVARVASFGEVESGSGGVDGTIGDSVELTRLLELARLGHVETEVKSNSTWDEGQTELETPDTIEFAVITVGEGTREAGKKDESDDRTEQVTL